MALTVIDAGILIGFLDGDDSHHDASRQSLDECLSRNDRIVLPASAFAEALVGPSRSGERAVAMVRALIERLPIEVAPLDEAVAVEAAAIRAEHPGIKLPDALVVATAKVLDAERLVTTDRRWPSARELGLSTELLLTRATDSGDGT